MTPERRSQKNNPLPVVDEAELFKKQFLKMRNNYENKIKELSVIKELVDMLRLTGISDKIMLFTNNSISLKNTSPRNTSL